MKPAPVGWTLDCDAQLMPTNFFSGGVAERKARELARSLVAQGQMAQVLIHDRSGALVKSTVMGPDDR